MRTWRAEKRAIRIAGALLGLAAAAAVLIVARPGAAGSPLPASVRFTLAPAGELEVTPSGPRPVLAADALRPGGPAATANFRLRNQAGSELSIGLRVRADSTGLDGLVRVRLSSSSAVLADGTLQGMELHPARLVLASGATDRLRLRAWIPREVLTGYEGQWVRVALVPEVSALGGRR